jgi:peptide chain release factor 1
LEAQPTERIVSNAGQQGWCFEKISHGGATLLATISGSQVYKCLQFENGVHRVQRVPVTEKHGRVHTSTATVLVLPQPENVDAQINMKDVLVETMRAGGAGGQHVNTTDSAVRMTHVPTGIVVASSVSFASQSSCLVLSRP